MFTVSAQGKIISFASPVVMGIVNITPDSFYDGRGEIAGIEQIRLKAGQMIADGAAILDLGAQSTRPGSDRLSAQEEWDRLSQVLKAIRRAFPSCLISIDTYHASVAELAVQEGADMINDISFGMMDKDMLNTIGRLSVPYIGMHMQGTPETMQINPTYRDVVTEVLDALIERLSAARDAGIRDLIIDPGFGFGKTPVHNFNLLQSLEAFHITGCPILVGLSRKSMVTKTLGIKTAGALNGTTVLHTLALLKGASILRVHDVREAVECITIMNAYQKNTGSAYEG